MKHLGLASIVLTICIAAASAQSMQYRWTDRDGKTNFGDNPPRDARNVQPMGTTAPVISGALDGLPFELRRVAEQFPVTIYITEKCSACDRGREMLRTRGVPYVERTVVSAADQLAFKRLAVGDQVPVLQVGSQRAVGFEDGAWQSLLDLAGYPRESRMPATYKRPPPLSLAPATNAPADGALGNLPNAPSGSEPKVEAGNPPR